MHEELLNQLDERISLLLNKLQELRTEKGVLHLENERLAVELEQEKRALETATAANETVSLALEKLQQESDTDEPLATIRARVQSLINRLEEDLN